MIAHTESGLPWQVQRNGLASSRTDFPGGGSIRSVFLALRGNPAPVLAESEYMRHSRHRFRETPGVAPGQLRSRVHLPIPFAYQPMHKPGQIQVAICRQPRRSGIMACPNADLADRHEIGKDARNGQIGRLPSRTVPAPAAELGSAVQASRLSTARIGGGNRSPWRQSGYCSIRRRDILSQHRGSRRQCQRVWNGTHGSATEVNVKAAGLSNQAHDRLRAVDVEMVQEQLPLGARIRLREAHLEPVSFAVSGG